MISDEVSGLISVIVPVYNVEPYLDRCVQSIVDQTYENLEIILVDDGSPDNCPAMCDAWAARDSRIKVIHKQNGGLSDARNAGMEEATGEYIGFVDSDDYIAPEMFEKLMVRMINTNSDIVSCDAIRVWDDDTPNVTMVHNSGDFVLDRTESMCALIQSTCLIQTVWNKLYKASLAKRILFEKGKIHEDEYWSWQAVSLASRVATINNAFYFYYQRTGSITGNRYTGFPMLVVEAKLLRHAYIVKEIPELKDIDSYNLMNTCFYQGILVLRHEVGDLKKKYMAELKRAISVCDFSKEFLSGLGFRESIMFYLIKHHLKLACMAAKLYGVE